MMHGRFRTPPKPLLLCAALLACLCACDGSGSEEDKKPIVGLLELPISHRTSGARPADATQVEIGVTEVRIDGESVLTLDNGKVQAADAQNDQLPKLAGKLGAKRALAITVHAATPFATLGQVLKTALASGPKELAFQVRKPNSTTESGWLVIKQSHFAESADDPKFNVDELVAWDSFTKVWEDALGACQASSRADCGYRPLAKAEGGKLDLMLRVRGSGLALRFRQTGMPTPAEGEAAPEKPKKPAVEMLEGIKAQPAAEEEAPEPSTEHVFTLRADQATIDPSPVSGIVKPTCSGQTCSAVLEAEAISMSGRVISLIGAAFPDGTPEPKLAWVLTKR